jgi:UDP-N-acetylmuramoylalanine--D-glutamate ligase
MLVHVTQPFPIPSSALVMGLGRFGGGLGVCQYLLNQGCHVTLTDIRVAEEFIEPLGQLQPWIDAGTLTLRLGGHKIEDFEAAHWLVVNPAIKPWASTFIEAARHVGAHITSEIVLTLERLPNRDRTIAITGTLGKSTTVSMIHHAMQHLGIRSHLGGNIGGSLLTQLDDIRPDDWVILELSSAQLWWINLEMKLNWSPHIAVVTNFQPNHLDWHPALEHYEQCKRSLCEYQSPGDIAILDGTLATWASPEATRHTIDEALESWPAHIELAIPGEHNRRNAMAALLAIESALPNVPRADIAGAIASFQGLPHRLQLVTTDANTVRWFNDSKSSAPDATNLALRTLFDDPQFTGRVHLIAGGYDKGIDLAPMFVSVPADRMRVHAIGATGAAIDQLAHTQGIASSCLDTLELAVHDARTSAKPGDSILLSPACASWDQFTNFEQRGERFEELAQRVLGKLTT